MGETTGLLHTEASRQPSAAELRGNCPLGAFPDSHQPLLAQHSSVHRAPDSTNSQNRKPFTCLHTPIRKLI